MNFWRNPCRFSAEILERIFEAIYLIFKMNSLKICGEIICEISEEITCEMSEAISGMKFQRYPLSIFEEIHAGSS